MSLLWLHFVGIFPLVSVFEVLLCRVSLCYLASSLNRVSSDFECLACDIHCASALADSHLLIVFYCFTVPIQHHVAVLEVWAHCFVHHCGLCDLCLINNVPTE